MDVLDGGPVEGFVGFFDVQFRGSPENPADFAVRAPPLCRCVNVTQVKMTLLLPRARTAVQQRAHGYWFRGEASFLPTMTCMCWPRPVPFSGLHAGNPAQVLLSTAPDPTGATHWGQQTFTLHPAVDCAPGDALVGRITVVRKKENHRLMEVAPRAPQGP